MPIKYGIKYGTNKGIIYGPGSAFPAGTPPPVAPFDGPDNWYVPASGADFTALGITAPTSLWLCQEAAGSLADTVGPNPLAAVGTVGYQAAVAGWTRRAATVTAGAGNGFGRIAGEAPNAATTSVMWLGYIDLTAGGGSSRCIITGSDSAGATELSARHSAANLLQVKCLAVSATGVGDIQAGGVHALALLYDRTNSRVSVYSDTEKLAGTYGAGVVDGNKGFRSGVVGAPGMSIVWGCLWTGADAELSDTQVKARLQALNILIPWS